MAPNWDATFCAKELVERRLDRHGERSVLAKMLSAAPGRQLSVALTGTASAMPIRDVERRLFRQSKPERDVKRRINRHGEPNRDDKRRDDELAKRHLDQHDKHGV